MINLERITESVQSVKFDPTAWRSAMPKGFSREAIGRLLGTSGTNLSSIEGGKSLPSLMLAMRFATLTGISMDKFISKQK